MNVKKFLESRKSAWNGGAPCVTCRHPKRKLIDRDLLEFNGLRKTAQTSAPWGYFCRELLRPKYKYNHDARALKKHLERCLGQKTY